jgi:hypothetical protein
MYRPVLTSRRQTCGHSSFVFGASSCRPLGIASESLTALHLTCSSQHRLVRSGSLALEQFPAARLEGEAGEAGACPSVEKVRAYRGQLEDQSEYHSGTLDGDYDRDYQTREGHDGDHRLRKEVRTNLRTKGGMTRQLTP